MIDPEVQAKLDALDASIKAVTDSSKVHDAILAANNLGVDAVPVFHCNHSGLWFPADYVASWGVDYGVGLGPDPVSEVLNSDYQTAPATPTADTEDITQLMHPVGNVRVQVDMILVPKALTGSLDANGNWVPSDRMAILAKDDMKMKQRIAIIFQNQLANPKSKLPQLKVMWASIKNPALLAMRGN